MRARDTRIAQVLDQRIRWVSCAIESVYHRHNVSAILRTCDALGIDRVDLVAGEFVPVRGAARGAERWLDLRVHQDPASAIRSIQAAGYRVYCADLSEDAVTPETCPLDEPMCLWMGAELVGVSPEALEAADGILTVPMRGFAQSLNVSVAAAMALRPLTERARHLHGDHAKLTQAQRDARWRLWMEREEEVRSGVRARSELPMLGSLVDLDRERQG